MRIRPTLAALAGTAAALAAAAPAHAGPTIQTYGFAYPTAAGTPVSCSAASHEASGIGVVACYLRGPDARTWPVGDDDAMPGPADSTGGVVAEYLPPGEYHVCVQARALLRDNTFEQSPVTCTRVFEL